MIINIIAAYMIAVLSIESIKHIITQITDPQLRHDMLILDTVYD